MKHTARGLLAVRLTPADVGKRVSVRTDTGMAPPAPRFTDTVGVLTSWSNGVLSVTRRDGTRVQLAESSVVAAKTVPAAPARPRGTPAASVTELTAVAARGWPGTETERLGDWTLRAAEGWTFRANSATRAARSAPGTPDTPELERLVDWYTARGLPPAIQVTTGAEDADELLDARLAALGWRARRPAVVQVGALAPLADRPEDPRVTVGRELSEEWLRGLAAARRAPRVARQVLAGGPSVWFALAPGGPDGPAAVGRCVVDGRWAGFAAVEVAEGHRRRGLATAVMAALARAALGEGASAAYLQVEPGNHAARALYARLGFTDHHHYHYRVAP